MTRLGFLAFLLVAACAAAPRRVDGVLVPTASFRLPTGPHPTAYQVDVELDPARLRLRGEATIAMADAAPGAVVLHAGELVAVLSASWDGTPLRVVPLAHEQVALVGRAVGGSGTLRLAWTAPLSRSRSAGAFAQQTDGDWYAYTQFEPTGARQLMPCFDEPGFKVPWQLGLKIPRELVALSNTPVASEVIEGAQKWVHFAPTPALPSYLVAFAVGPFELLDAGTSRRGVPIRVAVPRGHADEASQPIADTAAILGHLEDYFGMPFPYAKLDLVPIPSTEGFRAMEHPGLVTFEADLLLGKPDELTLADRQELAIITAHELAHQWFGNLVTPRWWDDIWLNESFASWLADDIVQAWQPGWDIALGAPITRSWLISVDGEPGVRPIRGRVDDAGQIQPAFDGRITYAKGQLVLDMFEAWIGRDRFRQAIRAYLAGHAGGAASHVDLLAELSRAAGRDVSPVFASFVDQPGVPLLELEIDCAGSPRLHIRQRRHVRPGAAEQEGVWQVPVTVAWWAGARTAWLSMVLTTDEASLPLPACPERAMANPDGRGYYAWHGVGPAFAWRDDAAWRSLPAVARLELTLALRRAVLAGWRPYADLLAAVPRLLADPESMVRGPGVWALIGLADELPAAQLPAFRAFVRQHVGPLGRTLGFALAPDQQRGEAQAQALVLGLLGEIGEDPAILAEARRLALAWLGDRKAIPEPLRRTVLDLAALRGDAALFDAVLVAARASRGDERISLYVTLARFAEPGQEARAHALLLSEGAEDVWWLLFRGRGDPGSRARRLAFFLAHREAIERRLPASSRPFVVDIAAGCRPETLAEAEKLFAPASGETSKAAEAYAAFVARERDCIARRQLWIGGLAGLFPAAP